MNIVFLVRCPQINTFKYTHALCYVKMSDLNKSPELPDIKFNNI